MLRRQLIVAFMGVALLGACSSENGTTTNSNVDLLPTDETTTLGGQTSGVETLPSTATPETSIVQDSNQVFPLGVCNHVPIDQLFAIFPQVNYPFVGNHEDSDSWRCVFSDSPISVDESNSASHPFLVGVTSYNDINIFLEYSGASMVFQGDYADAQLYTLCTFTDQDGQQAPMWEVWAYAFRSDDHALFEVKVSLPSEVGDPCAADITAGLVSALRLVMDHN